MSYSNNWTNANDPFENIPAVMSSLCNLFGMKISRTTIWKEMCQKGKQTAFQEIIDFCTKWNIEHIHLNMVPEHLNTTFFPALALMQNYRTILLMEKKGNDIIYIDSTMGWMKEDAGKLFKQSMGHIVLIEPNPHIQEDGFEGIIQQENDAIKATQEEIGLEIVDDFMTPAECKALYSLGKDSFSKSHVIAGKGLENMLSSVRTSSSAFLPGDNQFAHTIQQRAAEKFGLPVANFESVQLTAYGPGELYEVHTDAFDDNLTDILKHGQRIKTVLVYLTDEYFGGATIFPRLQMKVNAKLGRAVSWKSLDEKGRINRNAFHGGLPVLEGYKCVTNLWVRDKPWRT